MCVPKPLTQRGVEITKEIITKTYDYEREVFKMDEPEQYDVLGYRR
jgi:hypothetical protein